MTKKAYSNRYYSGTKHRGRKRRRGDPDEWERPLRRRKRSVVYETESSEDYSTEYETEYEKEENNNRDRKKPRKGRVSSMGEHAPHHEEPVDITAGLDELVANFPEEELGDEDSQEESLPRCQRRPRNPFGCIEISKSTTYYRCNVQTAIRDLDTITFTTSQLHLLKDTPFWPLFSILYRGPKQFANMSKKDESLIREIIMRLDVDTHTFYLGQVPVEMTKMDVQLILGVFGGSRMKSTVPMDDDYPPWVWRCFSCELRAARDAGYNVSLSKKHYLQKLVELIKNDDHSRDSDVLRCALFFVFAAVLLPNQGGPVPLHFFNYVEDIDSIKDLDWATIILDLLMSQLVSTKTLRAGGCAILLLYWLCEHTSLITAFDKNAFPRILKWDLRELYDRVSKSEIPLKLKDLDKSLVKSANLVPTTNELRRFKQMKVGWEAKNRKHVEPGPSHIGNDPTDFDLRFSARKNAVGSPSELLSRERISEGETQRETVTQPDRTPIGTGLDTFSIDSPIVNPKLSVRANLFKDTQESPVCGQPSRGETFLRQRPTIPDLDDDVPSYSLGMGLGSTQTNRDQVAEDAIAALRTELERTKSHSKELVLELQVANRVLCEKVAKLESSQKSLMDTISIHESTINNLEKTCDSLKFRNKGEDYVTDGILDGNAITIKLLQSDVKRLEGEVTRVIAANGHLQNYIHELQNPTDSQVLEEPPQQLLDAWVDLSKMSAEKDRLARQKADYSQIIDIQRTEIQALKMQSLEEVPSAFDRLYSAMQIPASQLQQSASNKSTPSPLAIMCYDKSDDQLISPKPPLVSTDGFANESLIDETCEIGNDDETVADGPSVAMGVKQRTHEQDRVKIILSPQLDTNELTKVNEGQLVIRRSSPRRSVPTVRQPLPLRLNKQAASLTSARTRDLLTGYWKKGGLGYVVWEGPKMPLGCVTIESILKILHHEMISSAVIDACAELILRVYGKRKSSKTTMIFTASVWGLIATRKDSKCNVLRKLIDDKIDEALLMEILLFPLLTSGRSRNPKVHGNHWTLLKYNVRNNEWRFYNSLSTPSPEQRDCHFEHAHVVVNYMHELMCESMAHSGKKMRPLKPLLEVDCAQQDPSSVDCGAVVLYNIQQNVIRTYKKVNDFTLQMSAEFRAQLATWLVDPNNAVANFTL